MKRRILMIALFAAALLGLRPSTLSAQVTVDLEADIPFPFVVGTQTMAPGKYIIHPLDEQNVMELKGESGSPVVFEFNRTEAERKPSTSELIFNKYGDREFLSQGLHGGCKGWSAA